MNVNVSALTTASCDNMAAAPSMDGERVLTAPHADTTSAYSAQVKAAYWHYRVLWRGQGACT